MTEPWSLVGYMVEMRSRFDARVEMMALAFLWKHRVRPLYVLDNAPNEGVVAAFATTRLLSPGPVDPRLMGLAEHAHRAWRTWTKIEPDAAIVLLFVRQQREVVLVIDRRAEEIERNVVARVLAEMDANEKRS